VRQSEKGNASEGFWPMTEKHKCFHAINLILLLLFSGCIDRTENIQPTPNPTATPAFDFGDGGLLSNQPCGPPCFWDIEPGQTTEAEASQILEKLGVLDDCLFFYLPDTHEGVETNTWSCPGNFGIGLRKDLEVVTSVNFTLQKPIELQKIIEKYGSPDYVWVFDTGFVDAPSASATIYFSKLRMQFLLPDLEAAYYYIWATTLISNVVYKDNQSMRAELVQWSDSIMTWKGYGNYP